MTENVFTSPKAVYELNGRIADAVLEAADEAAKRAEHSARETATAFANALHAQTERTIDAMTVGARLRTRSVAIAREVLGCAAPAAAK